jgi:hypothetical protein
MSEPVLTLSPDLKDKFFTAPDGNVWQVRQVFKRCLRADWIRGPSTKYRYRQRQTIHNTHGWREHTMSESLKKGDTLIWNGCERVTVDGFAHLGVFVVILLTGSWGMGADHSHQNALPYPDAQHLLWENLRLPFDGEKIPA